MTSPIWTIPISGISFTSFTVALYPAIRDSGQVQFHAIAAVISREMIHGFGEEFIANAKVSEKTAYSVREA